MIIVYYIDYNFFGLFGGTADVAPGGRDGLLHIYAYNYKYFLIINQELSMHTGMVSYISIRLYA